MEVSFLLTENEERRAGGAMSRDHFWSICTYPFSTNVGLNGRLLVPNLVDLVSL